jgi:hypothetical protein
LAEEFGRRAQPLPVVMDDVLVNFDPDRARQMARELLTFGQRHQVLLFTCHSFTRDMIREIEPSVPVLELPVHELPVVAPAAHLPTPADAVLSDEAVLELLREGPLGIAELAERQGCSPEQLRPVLAALRESGRVEMLGQKRGARYGLVP